MRYDISILQEGAAAWGITIEGHMAAQFVDYYDLLVRENEKVNLTAITAWEDVQRLHFLDSLALSAYLKQDIPENMYLIDVGTGAGFPGLVLGIVHPEWSITLLDARQNRVEFLCDATDALGLKNISVLHGRAERLAKEDAHREQYDIACARAVSSLRVLSEYLLPFVKTGGEAVAYKTQDSDAEAEEAGHAIQILGGGEPAFLDYQLPGTDVKRRLIRIKKNGRTPQTYPRREGIPEKRPL